MTILQVVRGFYIKSDCADDRGFLRSLERGRRRLGRGRVLLPNERSDIDRGDRHFAVFLSCLAHGTNRTSLSLVIVRGSRGDIVRLDRLHGLPCY